MREIRLIKWPYKDTDKDIYVDYHTSYLGNYFHNLIQKKKDPSTLTAEDNFDEDFEE